MNHTNLGRLTDHPTTDSFPAWSPDGTRVAFWSLRAGAPDINGHVLPATQRSAVEQLGNMLDAPEAEAQASAAEAGETRRMTKEKTRNLMRDSAS